MTKKHTTKKRWYYEGHVGFIVSRLHEYSKYLQTLERKFQEDVDALKTQCKDEILKAKGDPDGDIGDYYGEQIYSIESVFLHTFRYTAVMALYSFLESSMEQICEYLQKSKNLSLELTDLNGKGIKRAQLYLDKVAGIDFPQNSHAWHEIEKLNRIRNCIVHAEGNIARFNNRKVLEIISNTKGLSLKSDTFIDVDKHYLEEALIHIREILDVLYDQISQS